MYMEAAVCISYLWESVYVYSSFGVCVGLFFFNSLDEIFNYWNRCLHAVKLGFTFHVQHRTINEEVSVYLS